MLPKIVIASEKTRLQSNRLIFDTDRLSCLIPYFLASTPSPFQLPIHRHTRLSRVAKTVQCFTVKWLNCAFGKMAPRWIIKSSPPWHIHIHIYIYIYTYIRIYIYFFLLFIFLIRSYGTETRRRDLIARLSDLITRSVEYASLSCFPSLSLSLSLSLSPSLFLSPFLYFFPSYCRENYVVLSSKLNIWSRMMTLRSSVLLEAYEWRWTCIIN